MSEILNKKLLVLNFLIDYRVGGPHKYVDEVSSSLGDLIETINFTCGKSKWCTKNILNLRKISKYFYPFEVFINIFLILHFIGGYKKSNNRNLVVCIHGVHNIAPSIAAWIMGVPSIMVIHESMQSLSIFAVFNNFFIKLNKGKFLSVSSFGAKQYKVRNAQIVNSPIDLTYWNADGLSERDAYDGSRPLKLVFVGNLSRIKNIDGLINSFENVNFETNLNIIGSSIDEEYTNYLVNLSKKLASKNKNINIKFSGWMDSGGIKNSLYDADIFIMTSHSEGCPIALVEAIALGCLPLVTRVGDIEDFLSPINKILLIDGFTKDHISASLIRMKKFIEINGINDLNLIRENLKAVAKNKFDIACISKIFYSNYRNVLSQYYE